MSAGLRSKLKCIEPTKDDEIQDVPMLWNTGRDVPLTWSREELFRLSRQTLRDNFKLGNIDKKTYRRMVRNAKRKYGITE